LSIQLITSGDGSHTLFLPGLNETYHSLHGAIQESQHVFIEAGLSKIAETKREIIVFEVGFGTGLNALLTLIYALENSLKIFYHTLEPFPLDKNIFDKLNYINLLKKEDLKDDFLTMHTCEEGKPSVLQNIFSFTRYRSTLQDFPQKEINADVVYYDAFAPGKQPDMWSTENFKKIKSLMNSSGLLVTYCASGQFKRDLKEVGFAVETLAGPPGKKEMTRAGLKSM
jgi:tRNA U34 5-methylaminomethyl-2-thiouridine-forming methyltransferase MnmC